MKISTQFLFDRATQRMSAVQERLSTVQAQLSEGKQILSPSDAPDQASAIQRLRSEVDKMESHQRTLDVSLRRFGAEEVALRSSFDTLTRFSELSIQAANASVGEDGRKAIAIEMQGLRDELYSLGNTQDDSGNYVFSGTRSRTPAYATDASGQVVFQGDQTQTRVPAGVERTVKYTRSGTDVFVRVIHQNEFGEAIGVGFFDALDSAIAATKASDSAGIAQGLKDVNSMLDGVNLAIAEVGSDQAVVQGQKELLETTTLRMQTALSGIEDLDYAAAITQMSKESLALEAAQASFAKISQMSLFTYLR